MIMILIPLLALIGGFWAGKTVADRYHQQAKASERYALMHQFERLRAGVDADDPIQPYTPRMQVLDDEFDAKLKNNRRAIKWLNKKGA